MRIIISKITTLLAAALAVSTMAHIALASEPQPLGAEELKALISGNSMAGNGKAAEPKEPYDWKAYYAADGTMVMRLKPAWGGLEDAGKWWVTDKGELCRQFKQMAFGKEGCWLFYKEGAFYRFKRSSGTAIDGLSVILPGNILE